MSITKIILFFATMVFVVSNNACLADLSSDKSSLAALKSYVSDPKAILSSGWSDSTFVCNWTGVACGGLPLRVVGLNLSYAGLVGTVPPHLGNLSSLLYLLLHNNSFHGSLPDELSRLTQLKNLSVGYNELTGEIPPGLGTLHKLERLWLNDNQLSGSIPTSLSNTSSLNQIVLPYNQLSGEIPSRLLNLPKLEWLVLDGNQFSGSIPTAISAASTLKYISLSENHLTGEIPSWIGSLPKLEELWLLSNAISGSIPTSISNATSLQYIQLASNQLSGPFPLFLFNISSLKMISIDENNFYGTTLPDNICEHAPNIEVLYLSSMQLSGHIPSRISECKHLTILSMANNSLSGDIPKNFGNLTAVTDIDLSFNKLTGTIPEEIGKLINMQRLYLHINNLSGSFPKSILNSSKLSDLALSSNHLSGYIPNTLSSLKKLRKLLLDDNNLTFIKGTTNIFSTLGNFSTLEDLELSDNPLNTTVPPSITSHTLEKLMSENCNLRGGIPSSISNLSSLIHLALDGNELTGSLPPSIGMLHRLQALGLGDNMLHKPIPIQLCQLRSLYHVRLLNNKLSGPIPWCLDNATSLRKVDFSGNKLSLEIPLAIWRLRDLLEIDLSFNSLSGVLSLDIGNLKALTKFMVSNNQLSGNISSSIGDLIDLRILWLGSNKLHGSIPYSMGNLLSLEDLDLSGNSLSGVIPKSLEKLSHLKFLNLSSNKLYGEIPNGGPFSNFSADSYAQNDNLCGASRLLVPPCKTLYSRKASKARIIIPCSVAAIIIIFSAILLIIEFRRKRSKTHRSELILDTKRRVSRFELIQATNGFNEENLLGSGSFGSVYKGTLADGLVVAIKVFNLQLEEAFSSFSTECEVLCNIRHRNLVKVVTSCTSPDFKALILEYMPRGSLDELLYSDGVSLNILQRLNLMVDVASALEYLHYGYSTPIVHCDLKPSNVLVDEHMVAHVADFGIAKLLTGEDSMTHTMTLATIGYMAPEYGTGGVLSRKGDVFSFGIMLMEVFTKKKPTDEMFSGETDLKKWVENSLQSSIMEVTDCDLLRMDDIQYLVKKECITSILELALACSATSTEERIDTKITASTLNKIKTKYLNECLN